MASHGLLVDMLQLKVFWSIKSRESSRTSILALLYGVVSGWIGRLELILLPRPAGFELFFLQALQYSGIMSARKIMRLVRMAHRRRVHQNVIDIANIIATTTDPMIILERVQFQSKGSSGCQH